MTFLELLPKIILFLAIAWSIRQMLQLRGSILSGRIMVPASLGHLLLFILFELIVVIGGFSPLHLLWLWPVSFLLGIFLLFFPLTLPVLMFFIVLLRLTGKPKYEESEDVYLDDEYFDEEGEAEIIDVDFQSHTHSRRKSEKHRKKKLRKKRR